MKVSSLLVLGLTAGSQPHCWATRLHPPTSVTTARLRAHQKATFIKLEGRRGQEKAPADVSHEGWQRVGLQSGPSSGVCPSSCGRSSRSARTCTLPEGSEQKSSQQEPNFKQNQPNFAILIRSTKLSSIMDTDLFPWQCPSQREEDNRLKLPLANKNRDQLKSMSIQKLSASLPDISG